VLILEIEVDSVDSTLEIGVDGVDTVTSYVL
jgi:hypothetical protein